MPNAMNKNTRFGIIAIALAGLAGLGYYAYTANRSPAAVKELINRQNH